MRVSGGEKDAEQEAVVWVRRSDWESVTEREELVGRLRLGSRLPQYLLQGVVSRLKETMSGGRAYLITAILTGAVVLAR